MIILLNLSIIVISHAQMYQVSANNFQGNITKISFFSNKQGYVAFHYSIGYTVDSGRTFTPKYITNNNVNFNGHSVNLTFGFGISGVKAFDQNTVIVYGDYGFVPAILYSTNGGSSFTLVYHSQFAFVPKGAINDMIFPQNGNIGYAVDEDRILKTNDRGLSWNVVRTEEGKNFNYLDAVDDNTIFAYNSGSPEPSLVKSTDAGNTWQTIPLPVGNTYLNCADFISVQKGWLNMRTNNEYKLYYTSNGGIDWLQINDNEANPFFANKMTFVDDSTGYAITGLFETDKTTNAGKLWEPLRRDNSFSVNGYGTHNDFQVFNYNRIWAGGSGGFLELSTNAGGTPYPKAFFKFDRSDAELTGVIKLVNYSGSNYQYKWYKSGTLISTSYNASYNHDLLKLRDTVSLVVSDNFRSDSVTRYIDFPLPISISSSSPATGKRRDLITITGNNLSSVTGVFFGGVPAYSFTIVSNTQINAQVGEGNTGNVSIANVIRKDSLPGFRFTGTMITSFAPTTGTLGSTVTINGSNLSGVTSVRFGETPATSFSIIDSTQIDVVVGPGTTGNVSLSSPNGSTVLPGFVYTGPTVITSFSPITAGPFTEITITGVNLTGATAISFGGMPALGFKPISATTILATVNTGMSGNIAVTTKSGATALLGGFVFTPLPIITSFVPVMGQPGTPVIINGKNFNTDSSANTVYFGSVKAVVTKASDTQLEVTVPVGATLAPIAITSNKLTVITSKPFLLTFPGAKNAIPSTTFSRKIDLSTKGYVADFCDFDGDGKADMVTADIYAYKFSIAKNTSTGNIISFGTPLDFFSGNGYNAPYIYIQAADMDGDGKPDLLLTLLSNDLTRIDVYIYKNITENGVITFQPRTTYISYSGASSLATSEGFMLNDLDEDGKTDLVFWHGDLSTRSQLYFYKNNSFNGIITLAAKKVIYQEESGFNATSISLNDIDNDGKSDLVLTQGGSLGALSILLNKTANGNIAFAPRIQFYTYENALQGPSLCDLDQDDIPDLIFKNYSFNHFTILKNLSIPGAVSFSPKINYAIAGKPNTLSIGDIDGDSRPDIAVSVDFLTNGPQSIAVFKNISSPGIISFADSVNFKVGSNPGGVTIGDLNGDGRPEMVFGNSSPTAVSIMINKTEGSFIQLCENGSGIINSDHPGTSYQWQANGGNGFTNVTNDTYLTGTNTNALQLTNIPLSYNGYQYRCLVDGKPGFIYTLQFVNSWEGTVSSAWENSANWSCGKVPDSTTVVVINRGTVILNSNATIKSIKINTDANFIVNTGYILTITH